jgi:pantetheine-phosphate adenylyltransferase
MPEGRRLALYPGTFDPVHYGHLDVARRAARLFERLEVAVVRDRPAKPLLFTTDERVDLFRAALADVPNVDVRAYDGLTVNYAREQGARCIVRGLRGPADLEFERQLATMNRHLAPEVDTVFLATAPQHEHLSSSLIKEVVANGGPTDGLVPPAVAAALLARLGRAGG